MKRNAALNGGFRSATPGSQPGHRERGARVEGPSTTGKTRSTSVLPLGAIHRATVKSITSKNRHLTE